MYTWVEISASALNHNIVQYKSINPNTQLAPVIKSNAYGHGMIEVAKLCQEHASVARLCVISINEALQLRKHGITKPLIVLSIPRGDYAAAITNNVECVLFDYDMAAQLNTIAQKIKKVICVHLKCDTGLSRLGLSPENAFECIKKITNLAWLRLVGIFTHFAESENSDQTFTTLQLERYTQLIHKLQTNLHVPPVRHTSCTAAITAQSNSHQTLMRFGIGMYGLWPSLENKILTQNKYPHFFLKPVLSWKTKILSLKEVPAGSFVGYDRTFCTTRTTKIATLPIGYWDGYERHLSNRGKVLIHNKLAPIIGRIAMNLTMVDVTEIDCRVDDEVTLLGNHPGITAEDLADHCGTINYEIVTRINPLLPRIVVE